MFRSLASILLAVPLTASSWTLCGPCTGMSFAGYNDRGLQLDCRGSPSFTFSGCFNAKAEKNTATGVVKITCGNGAIYTFTP